jgi:site-specific recombinase XerD
LRQVTPGLAGEYIAQLQGSAPTKNQALAALRHFFDALVQRHAVALNPFASVRGLKYSVTEGKTAELAIEQARKLFRSIDNGNVVGLRDLRRARRAGLHRCPHRRRGQTPAGRLPKPR